MSYTLYIGDRMFSSWSLRGWLLFDPFNIPCETREVGLYSDSFKKDMEPIAPARLVPSLRLPDGTVFSESLAIAETLNERHPDAGIWPADASKRAVARWLCAEMASSFAPLRDACAMQLHGVWDGFTPSGIVRADLERLETIWAHARGISGVQSGYLFGDYSATEAFFTPVAARIVGYKLPASESALDYCRAMLSHPSFKKWRTEALKDKYDPLPHDMNLPRQPWPEVSTAG